MEGTLAQLDEDEQEIIISFYWRVSPVEQNIIASDREPPVFIDFLEGVRCCYRIKFKTFTDSQLLKCFFDKFMLSKLVVRWINKLGVFGALPISLRPGNFYFLGDALQSVPNDGAVLNTVKVLYVEF